MDYSDEYYYIYAGEKYIKGFLPYEVNPEHPPLAKYLIGISSLIVNNPRFFSYVAGLFTIIFFYMLLLHITSNETLSLFATVLLISEIPFIKVFNYALLEPYLILFSTIAVYIMFKRLVYTKDSAKLSILEGCFWGLALASKWSIVYTVLGAYLVRLYVTIRRSLPTKNLKSGLFVTFVALTLGIISAYLLPFLYEIVGRGFGAFIDHNVLMFVTMRKVHTPSLYSVIRGLTFLFIKTTFWYRFPDVLITVTMVNNTIINFSSREVNLPFTVEVDIMPSFGGFILPLTPFIYVYLLLTWKQQDLINRTLTILGLISFGFIIHGSVPWYYAFPTLMNTLIITRILKPKYLVLLIIANYIYYLSVYILGLNKLIILGIS